MLDHQIPHVGNKNEWAASGWSEEQIDEALLAHTRNTLRWAPCQGTLAMFNKMSSCAGIQPESRDVVQQLIVLSATQATDEDSE